MMGGNLGKDFIAGWVALWYFLTNKEVRVITTSVKDDHLRVLWSELGRHIQLCRIPLTVDKGGPLIVNHRDIRKYRKGEICQISYIRGMVSERGEGLSGHHAESTLALIDEACHDEKTEILSENGWRKWYELNVDERLLTMNPEFRQAEYVKPTAVHVFDHDGPMYLYERRCGNFCVTPNHRMLWKKQRSKCARPYTPYYLEEIQKINGTSRHIPRCFRWKGEEPKTFILREPDAHRAYDKNIPMEAWVKFLGWCFSEGSLQWDDGRPTHVVLSQKVGPNFNKIADVVYRCGFNPLEYPNGNAPSIRINNKMLARWVLSHGRYCWEKHLPSFLKTLSPRLIETFLQAYKEGDGYDKNSGRDIIYTSSEKIANDLQILSYLAGRESTICKRDLIGLPILQGRVSQHDGFVVARSKIGLDSHLKIKREYLDKIHYKGKVFCATVPLYHTLFTRRNGVCMWSGNSGVVDTAYEMMTAWAKRMLIIGNCHGSDGFWFKGVQSGDILAK